MSNSSVFTNTTVLENTIDWFEIGIINLCILSALANVVNIIVFLNHQLKDTTYKYMLVISISDFVYILLVGLESTYQCGTLCDERKMSLEYQIFTIWFTDFLTSCLAIMNILIELFVSIQRLFIISNKSFFANKSTKTVLVVLFVFSLCYYSPVLFINYITTNTNGSNNTYKIERSEFGESNIGRVIPAILSGVRLFLVVICLSIVNLITFIEFKKHLSKKTNLKLHLKANSQTNYSATSKYS